MDEWQLNDGNKWKDNELMEMYKKIDEKWMILTTQSITSPYLLKYFNIEPASNNNNNKYRRVILKNING